jgi:membrane fusion protein (multidrug efflux system)
METQRNEIDRKLAAPAPTRIGAPAAEEPKKRRPLVFVGAAAAITLAILGGYLLVTAGEEDTDDAQVASDMVPVGTRVAGQILKVRIAENQAVKKGDVLADIDDADYVARVKQAEAELASQQAQAKAADAQVAVTVASSKGGLASARAAFSGSSVNVGGAAAQVAAARAGLVRAQTDLKRSEIDLARTKELRAANAVPQERLDNAQLAHDSAQAALSQAQANVALAEEARRAAESRVGEARGLLDQSSPIEARITSARAQADLAHARANSAAAALELARLQLSYTKIVAPADGVASKLSVHDGQLVSVGQPIVELVPLTTYVVANFKETQIGKMKPGQRAVVRLDAFPGKKLIGRVESLSGATGASFSLMPADNATGNFVKVVQRVPVRIAWENLPADLPLRAGLSADVTVEVGR